jgi:hypothetical protein
MEANHNLAQHLLPAFNEFYIFVTLAERVT